ncbi:Mitochondrial transcription termination factor family protein [Quillaja saponaria]|uniref:Mitochondrial transcription termination factor family protein n=1 Tax=Quillaja saponaria TaxID=32244 RepID=A0AAD7VK53_QUISA|nr:Mitochondrial transcription termination factor family protein [Quillaja saponaria]
MFARFVTRSSLLCLSPALRPISIHPNQKTQYFSTNSSVPFSPKFSEKTLCNEEIHLAKLFQRYGFPTFQLHSFLAKSSFLLNSSLQELEQSLLILLSFRIPQNSLVSLVIDCPGILEFQFLKNWEMGFSKLGFSNVSPLTIRNLLEHSKKFQLEPHAVLKSINILRGLGFSHSAIDSVLKDFPRAIMMNERDIRSLIDFLTEIGIRKNGTDRILCLFPRILGLGIENRLKPLFCELGNLGFCDDELRKEIVREPKILGMELGEFSRCLQLLQTLNCRARISEKIYGEGVFRAGFQVKLRIDCLCSHGLIRREAFKILWKEPRLITYEIEDIEKKIEFLVYKMKCNVDCLPDVPEYLGVNFDKQIVPRHNVMEYLIAKGAIGFEVGLKDLIKPSRLRFYNLYVKPYPECEKMFGRFSGNAEVKINHPFGLWKLLKPKKYPESREDVVNMKSFMELLF